jgi:hypothetical protein
MTSGWRLLGYVDNAPEGKSSAVARRASKLIFMQDICGDPTAGDG